MKKNIKCLLQLTVIQLVLHIKVIHFIQNNKYQYILNITKTIVNIHYK